MAYRKSCNRSRSSLNRPSSVAALGVAGALVLGAGPAAAAPVTYAVDQAFWGSFPGVFTFRAGSDVWQAGRADAVAADPDAFSYARGEITIDFEAKRVADYDFELDLGPLGIADPVPFRKDDPAVTVDRQFFPARSTPTSADQLQLYLNRSFGPDRRVAFADGTSEMAPRYRIAFDFVLNQFPEPDADVTLLLRADVFEFRETPLSGVCISFDACLPFDADYALLPASPPDTETYGGAGVAPVSVTAVPLPPAAALLLSGLAAVVWRGRRA